MTLVEEMMDACKIMNRIRVDDPYGGYTESWSEGASFDATIIKNTTTQAQIAEKQDISELFTVVTKNTFPLAFHEVFKRVKDGEIFRVTSNSTDSDAPARSTVKIAKVTAEKWVLPA